MIRHDIYLKRYDWRITVYYSVTCYYLYEIMDALRAIEVDKDSLAKAYRNISSCKLDTGLTFSNPERRESVMVIGTASNADEYANSIAHESQHLIKHITKALRLDPYGEEICYIAGDIGAAINHHAHALYCDECLESLRKNKERAHHIW